ncbi:WD40-repeat-containing domain protein [Lipomyces tetrasporus]|uniref:WD40-repeat-containing domain protein n=1 Tax=Lipomyces tetrasporus TaxID=54092 RepID=A0AAD7QSB8_9ASCO|nr:WD40-repeat-containing domain protein [Lipomyces tetrasporus]KAJ8100558.1 WD40-repeat-containing domain protein [Lipomyces tetrasporus]
MPKRQADEEETVTFPESALKSGQRATTVQNEDNEVEGIGEFEDPYGDDFESEGEIDEQEDEIIELNDDDEDNEEAAIEGDGPEEKSKPKETPRLYLPHRSAPLGADEVLEPDPTVYDMLHQINLNWPCLSFDILPDNLGNERRGYPKSTYFITGTQAKRKRENEITVVKLSDLSKTLQRDDDSEPDSDNDDNDSEPILESRSLPTTDTTNRIRVSPHAAKTNEYLTASMSESGDVYIWDITPHFTAFDTPGTTITKAMNRPVHTIRAHGGVEGYALDWSPHVTTGQLLTGDVTGRIHLTTRGSNSWTTDKVPYVGHENGASVEELQWSQSEKSVFASGGSDGFIRVWDTRSKKHKPALSVRAATSDVNVMSWSKNVSYLLASGHDDGSWSIWDLRTFKANANDEPPLSAASFSFNKSPITSIEFHPTEESIVAVSSADNTVMLWDLSVEADDEEIAAQKRDDATGELDDIPPQLLFVHWQKDVKEVHWHRQIPGMLMSTGGEGISVWKSISV